MFLNLKSKRVENALQSHLKAHNHPKTQREERPERLSKEHGEVRVKKTVNAIIKKQTASTALTTMQPGSSCSNVAHHYVIHRIESLEKEGHESFNKSVEKMDSQRSQKIANAYRKIKKHEGADRTHTEESGEQRIRKSQNRSYYPMSKKEAVANLNNNYIAITEADEHDRRNDRNEGADVVQYCFKMIQLLLQVFRGQQKGKSSSVVKFRSLSSKEIDINDSLEKGKRSNKNLKAKVKIATSREHDNESLSEFVDKIRESLAKCQQTFQALNDRYQQGNSLNVLMKEFYAETCSFVKQMQQKCLSELEEKCSQYEKGLQIVILQQNQIENHCKKLEQALAIERNRNEILAQSLQEMHNRSLYSCAFLNQASFHFDLDTFIREKIYQYTEEDSSLRNRQEESHSSFALKKEFLQSDFAFLKEKRKG